MKNKKSFFIKVFIVISILFFFTGIIGIFQKSNAPAKAESNSILALDLKGVLMDRTKFLKNLRKYTKSEKIKGVLIRMDSPGGSVAVSQEIYEEFNKIRKVLKKPVVISVGAIMASGALYAAAGATSVLVNPGTLVGSIGVIFPLINLERLYEWAKVEPYSIKTGEFKDAGTRARLITPKERALFQDLVDELLNQFKAAIIAGRNISAKDLELYTDARVFTGETAVSAGFADSIGTYSDAIKVVGEITGLGKNPTLFTPQPGYLDRLSNRISSVLNVDNKTVFSALKKQKLLLSILGFPLSASPMYVFPPAIGM